MKKKIVYTYEWWRSDGTQASIPVHHETTLMGYTERYMLSVRKGRVTNGRLKFTVIENKVKTPYEGKWEVNYEY